MIDIEKYKFAAHRGLFNNKEGIPENSIPAFQNAIEKGYAIELDIQMTEDGFLVVFHDTTLTRMAGIKEQISMLDLSEVKKIKLLGTDYKIPTFEDVLMCVAGRVPLIVEVKTTEKYKELMPVLMNELSKYNGDYVIESFDPRIVYWLKKNAPEVKRGQVAAHKIAGVTGAGRRKRLAKMAYNLFTKPDFVAYDHNKVDFKFYNKYKKKNVTVVVWAVRTKEEYDKVKRNADCIIFENEETIK